MMIERATGWSLLPTPRVKFVGTGDPRGELRALTRLWPWVVAYVTENLEK